MKKNLMIVCLAVALVAMPACKGGRKKAILPTSGNVTELVDSIKNQAMDLFAKVRTGQSKIIDGVQMLPENIRLVPAHFFMPLDAAQNAVTLAQQCALIGVYSVDNQYDKLAYGTKDVSKRNNVLVQLTTKANLAGDTQDQIDRLSKLSQEEFNAEVDKIALEKFEQSLEDNDADCYLIILLYSIVEAALNQEAVFEAKNGYIDDEQIVADLIPFNPVIENAIALVELLKPYYSTLNIVAPIVDKLKAVIQSNTEDNRTIATINAYNYVKELRGKLNVSVNAD